MDIFNFKEKEFKEKDKDRKIKHEIRNYLNNKRIIKNEISYRDVDRVREETKDICLFLNKVGIKHTVVNVNGETKGGYLYLTDWFKYKTTSDGDIKLSTFFISRKKSGYYYCRIFMENKLTDVENIILKEYMHKVFKKKIIKNYIVIY